MIMPGFKTSRREANNLCVALKKAFEAVFRKLLPLLHPLLKALSISNHKSKARYSFFVSCNSNKRKFGIEIPYLFFFTLKK